MSALSQAEGDEILEILVRACDVAGSQGTLGLLARISVLLGREVGVERLRMIADEGLKAAPINPNKGR